MSDEATDHGVRSWLPLVLAVGASIAVFWPTMSLLVLPDAATGAGATAALLPIGALVAAIAAIGRGGPPTSPKLEPALLGAIPMLLIALALSVLGVARLGFDFHEAQLGMVAWAAFVIGLLMTSFGVRATTRHGAVAVLVLTMPPISQPILRALEHGLTLGMQTASERMSTAFGLGVTARGDGVFASGTTGDEIVVASACSGIDALALAAITLCGLLVLLEGRGWWKLLLALVAIPLVLVGNILRITLLLALHGGGHATAFSIVHTVAGIVIAAGVAAFLVLIAPRFRLIRRWVGFGGTRVEYSRKYVLIACSLAALTGLGCVVGQRAAYERGDESAGAVAQLAYVDSAVDRTSERASSQDRPRLVLEAAGHDVRPDASFPWMRTIFGSDSESGAYTLFADGRAPVWAQVVVAPSRRDVDRYAPLDCFIAHGARIVRVQRVELPGGAGMLVDQRLRGTSFSALSWRQPVRMPDGQHAWRRVVLFAMAQRGSDQLVPTATGLGDRAAFGLLNVLSPAAATSPRGWAYGPAGRRLVDAAESILAS